MVAGVVYRVLAWTVFLVVIFFLLSSIFVPRGEGDFKIFTGNLRNGLDGKEFRPTIAIGIY